MAYLFALRLTHGEIRNAVLLGVMVALRVVVGAEVGEDFAGVVHVRRLVVHWSRLTSGIKFLILPWSRSRLSRERGGKNIELNERTYMKTTLLLPILGLLMASQAASLMAAQKPVLMVLANRDFYYQEYSETRRALEASGLAVKVAAATTARSVPTPGTGQPNGSDGGVVPDLALAGASSKDYSAIVFVGGWGSSMYQYAYNDPNLDGAIDSYYANPFYNGDDNLSDGKPGEAKAEVNRLINDFVDQDKYVAAICHGVSVLAWARVDGVSPLQGKKVTSSTTGSPATFYLGRWYADYELSVHEQIIANGGFTNPYSGQYGNPTTAADDVIVDGRVITAENYTSAPLLGRVIAGQILKGRN